LLKILSRISEPTSGRVRIKGRVASLLEVGTGFHPELTGRENIFLNGAILGMSKAEIERRFDEIVAFSEIEKFLDTPVKRYSSGMYVRLAFAVAAHLEPEILIVDEVLAVGDAQFQKKCLNKLQEVGTQGRTILFVSHDVSAVTRLCSRAILLQGGTVFTDGRAYDVAAAYLRTTEKVTAERVWPNPTTAPQNHVARLRALRVFDSERNVREDFDVRRPIGIEMEFDVLEQGHLLVPCVSLRNESGVLICLLHDHTSKWHRKPRMTGRFRSVVWIPENLLTEGSVFVGAAVGTHTPAPIVHCSVADAVGFRVVDPGLGDTSRGDYGGLIPGIIRPHWKWDAEHLQVNS
jgi:lipopolysaccharide transport system ATP-binding protein